MGAAPLTTAVGTPAEAAVWPPEAACIRLAAAAARSLAFCCRSLIPGVMVTRGGWFGTRCVILTDLRPSSVKISVNWLMYRKAFGRVPRMNRQVEPLFSFSR